MNSEVPGRVAASAPELLAVAQRFHAERLPGRMSIRITRQLPTCYLSLVDADTETGVCRTAPFGLPVTWGCTQLFALASGRAAVLRARFRRMERGGSLPQRVTKDEVLCYVVRDGKLLVFRHTDFSYEEVGIQVPAGSLREGETPEAAALREAGETGLMASARTGSTSGAATSSTRS
ncbi:NUDIX domain-containing protein [Streptomyces sp. NRRL S-337]|uniref:NUDIX domain-containing protein n=1 Tax=Streptomyces sp. NRRL S-337 TaxID=1463900 RepID=UPI001F19EE8D|nr:NUDIX domain-containing protein [Streptomyces sp. NRRL S-337]